MISMRIRKQSEIGVLILLALSAQQRAAVMARAGCVGDVTLGMLSEFSQ